MERTIWPGQSSYNKPKIAADELQKGYYMQAKSVPV